MTECAREWQEPIQMSYTLHILVSLGIEVLNLPLEILIFLQPHLGPLQGFPFALGSQ